MRKVVGGQEPRHTRLCDLSIECETWRERLQFRLSRSQSSSIKAIPSNVRITSGKLTSRLHYLSLILGGLHFLSVENLTIAFPKFGPMLS